MRWCLPCCALPPRDALSCGQQLSPTLLMGSFPDTYVFLNIISRLFCEASPLFPPFREWRVRIFGERSFRPRLLVILEFLRFPTLLMCIFLMFMCIYGGFFVGYPFFDVLAPHPENLPLTSFPFSRTPPALFPACHRAYSGKKHLGSKRV